MSSVFDRQRAREQNVSDVLQTHEECLAKQIIDALAERGITSGLRDTSKSSRDDISLSCTFISGVGEAYISTEFRREHKGTGFHSRLNGKLRFNVGEYGDTRVFRMRKDGSMRIDDIADEISDRLKGAIARKTREQTASCKRHQNETVRVELCNELGVSEWSPLLGIDYNTGNLQLRRFNDLSASQAKAMVKLAIEIGLVKPTK